MFASADEIVGEAFCAFVVIDDDFVEVGEGVDFAVRCLVEGVWTVGDGMFVDNRDGEVEIVPETVGMIGKRIDVFGTVCVELRLGVELN